MNVKMIGLAVLAGVMVAGCDKQKAEAQEDVMAVSVNGEKLMKSAIDADVDAVIKAQGDKIPAERLEYVRQKIANQMVQGFIIEKVLIPKAKADGFVVIEADRKAREAEFLKVMEKMPDAPKSLDEYFKSFPLGEARGRAEFENGILIDKMIKAEQAKVAKKDYSSEAQKCVDAAVSNNVVALKRIKEFKAQLDKLSGPALTNKFAELAKANSDCPSKEKGGDLGLFQHGQMVKEFDEVAFKLPVNKVSDPVKTQFGYHLVMVTKKVPAVAAKGDTPATPEKVQASHILIRAQDVPKKEDIVKFKENEDGRKFTQEFVTRLIKESKIEASEEYKQFLPQTDEPACKGGTCECEKHPVEKPAQK